MCLQWLFVVLCAEKESMVHLQVWRQTTRKSRTESKEDFHNMPRIDQVGMSDETNILCFFFFWAPVL